MALIPSYLWRDSATVTGTPGEWITAALPTGGPGISPSGTTWRFLKVDRTVHFSMTILGNAAATGFTTVTLPYTAKADNTFAAREWNQTGLTGTAFLQANSSTMTISRYDNGNLGATPGGGGNTNIAITVTGQFEANG